MRNLTAATLLLALIAPFAQAQESLTTQRMAERIFLFHDMRSDILARGRIVLMAAPMEKRMELHRRYLNEANKIDYAKLRMKFAQDLQSELNPDEIARLYKFQMEHCMLISDKLARVRTEVTPIHGSLALYLINGFDTLGDFSIEHVDSIPVSRLKVLAEFRKPVPEAELIDEDMLKMLKDAGVADEDARQIILHWSNRILAAQDHALAKHLDEREIRQFLTPLSDPALATLAQRSHALLESAINRLTDDLMKSVAGR